MRKSRTAADRLSRLEEQAPLRIAQRAEAPPKNADEREDRAGRARQRPVRYR